MKKLSTYLFLIFFSFSTPSFANDIRDFQIEGMSIGDSLLKYLSEKDIKVQLEKTKDLYSYTDKKFRSVYIYEGPFEIYEYVSANVKYGDKKYIIYAVRGMVDFSEGKDCYKKKEEIVSALEIYTKELIKNEWTRKHPVDKTGKSKATSITWDFSTGATVSVTCYDFAKHVDRTSGLDVAIRSAEFSKWLRKY